MEIKVNDNDKVVEVWLTNDEKDNPALQKQLKPLYQKYKEKRYTVAVFRSGQEDLVDATSALLCYNKKRIVEQKTK